MLFLRKPKHKEKVIATSKGWAVERTGELLVSVKNLDKKILEHFKELNEVVEDIEKANETVSEPVKTVLDELTIDDTVKDETDLDKVLDSIKEDEESNEIEKKVFEEPKVEEPKVEEPKVEEPKVTPKRRGRPAKAKE